MGGRGLRDYLDGYIIVRAEGLNPEKFINMSSRYGIVFWDIKRISFTTIEFKMKHNQYKQLKKIINKTGSRTKVMKKHGLNFLLNLANKRRFFLLGIGIFLSILVYLSSLVWKIEVKGNKKVETQRIYDVVKKAGLEEGKLKNKVNLRRIESILLKEIKEISVVNIKFYGTKANIEIVERTMPPSILNSDVSCNIVAVKEGIITRVFAYKGQPLIKSGDLVKEDTILISGIILDSNNESESFVHAMGEVYAKTWYEKIESINLNYKKESRTGRVKKKEYYIIGGRKVYVKNDTIDFEKYDRIKEKNKIKLRNYETPIEKVTETFYEKIEVYKRLTYDEAYELAINKIEIELKKEMPRDTKLLDKKIDKSIDNGIAMVRILYVLEENIGIQKPIN